MPIWVCVSSQLYYSFLTVSFSSDSALHWHLFFLEPAANPWTMLGLRRLKIQNSFGNLQPGISAACELMVSVFGFIWDFQSLRGKIIADYSN